MPRTIRLPATPPTRFDGAVDERRHGGPHALREERQEDALRRVVDGVVLQRRPRHRADARR